MIGWLVLVLILAAADAGKIRVGKWSKFKKPFKMECPEGETISSISAFHLKARKDSVFKFQCKESIDAGSLGAKMTKQPFKMFLDKDSKAGGQHFGHPGSNCLQGFALVGIQSRYKNKQRMLRLICQEVAGDVDADACVLAALHFAVPRKRKTGASPVHSGDGCHQYAAWGAQLPFPYAEKLTSTKGGQLLLKWCPVEVAEAEEGCEEAVEELLEKKGIIVSQELYGVKEIVEVETEESQVIEITNEKELKKSVKKFKKEQKKKEKNGAKTSQQLQSFLAENSESQEVADLLKQECSGTKEDGAIDEESITEFEETVVEIAEGGGDESDDIDDEEEEVDEDGEKKEDEDGEEIDDEGDSAKEEEEMVDEEEEGEGPCLCVCTKPCDSPLRVKRETSVGGFADWVLSRFKRGARKTKTTRMTRRSKKITRRTKKTKRVTTKKMKKTKVEGKSALVIFLDSEQKKMNLCPEEQCQCDGVCDAGDADSEEEELAEEESEEKKKGGILLRRRPNRRPKSTDEEKSEDEKRADLDEGIEIVVREERDKKNGTNQFAAGMDGDPTG